MVSGRSSTFLPANRQQANLSKLRANVAKAATVLRDLYGEGALERASSLVRRSPQSQFARMVTAELLSGSKAETERR